MLPLVSLGTGLEAEAQELITAETAAERQTQGEAAERKHSAMTSPATPVEAEDIRANE